MVPAPAEPPDNWWGNVGFTAAVAEQATIDGGLTGNDDPFVAFYADVPRALAEEALTKEQRTRRRPREQRHGRWIGGRRYRRDQWCAPKTASCHLACNGDLLMIGLASCQRRSTVDTAWRSAVRSNSLTCSRATSPCDLLADLELLTHRTHMLAHLIPGDFGIAAAQHS